MGCPHPERESIARRLEACRDLLTSRRGVAFRNTSMSYANREDLLTGEGSARFAGRWNPEGIPTVYASVSLETATAELQSHFRYYGVPLHHATPRVLVAIEYDLSAVLDVTEGRTRQRLRFSRDRMTKEDWRAACRKGPETRTQSLGRSAFAAGIEGLLVPSAAHAGQGNLVVFPGNLRASSRLSIYRGELLPPGPM